MGKDTDRILRRQPELSRRARKIASFFVEAGQGGSSFLAFLGVMPRERYGERRRKCRLARRRQSAIERLLVESVDECVAHGQRVIGELIRAQRPNQTVNAVEELQAIIHFL